MITARQGVALLAMVTPALLAGGCSDSRSSAGQSGPIRVRDLSGPGNAGASAAASAAVPEANDFLKKLCAGDTKAALGKLAVSFRKEISGPLTFEEEKKLGYSDADAEKYLREQGAGAGEPVIHTQSNSPTGQSAVFRGALGAKPEKIFSLRLGREGDAWKVTRFAASAKILGGGIPAGPAAPELIWARESAVDFIESLIGSADDQTLTMNTMTERFKSGLPAPSVPDSGLKYAKKDVRDWLNKARTGVKGYEVTGQSKTPQGAAFTGALVGPGLSSPFTLFVVPDGEAWLVDRFDVKQ